MQRRRRDGSGGEGWIIWLVFASLVAAAALIIAIIALTEEEEDCDVACTNGVDGARGPAGLNGTVVLCYARFYGKFLLDILLLNDLGLTAGTGNGGASDYAATIAPGTPVPFPRNGASSGCITRFTNVTGNDTNSVFNIPNVGIYAILFRLHTTEPGQLELTLNAVELPDSLTEDMNPTSGGHLIFGEYILNVTTANSVLRVFNPAGNTPALTVTPADGSRTHANVGALSIQQIA